MVDEGLPVDGRLGDEDAFDQTVGSLAAALALRDLAADDAVAEADVETLPVDLRARISADAARYFGDVGAGSSSTHVVGRIGEAGGRSRTRVISFAAAAMLFLTCGLIGLQVYRSTWFTQQMLMAERTEFLGQYGVLVDYRTLCTMDEAPRGDIVWCDEAQRGYVTIGGLPVSQPGVDHYRIWMYLTDSSGAEHAIDAGVFVFDDRDCELIVKVRPMKRCTTSHA